MEDLSICLSIANQIDIQDTPRYILPRTEAPLLACSLGCCGAQAVSCIVGIILAGRVMLRPLYRRIADLDNAAIFSATTLLVVLGTSMVTQIAGLSLALGAFLVSPCLPQPPPPALSKSPSYPSSAPTQRAFRLKQETQSPMPDYVWGPHTPPFLAYISF